MAIDPTELMSPRDRMAYSINMRTANGAPSGPPDGSHVAQKTDFFGADGLGFEDVLDIVNPLQHLPLVATAYRAVTGDEISAGARVLGGGLYGGPAGMFSGAIDAAIAEANGGKDLGGIAVASLTGEESAPTPPKPEIAVAAADVAAIEPAAGVVTEAPPAEARAWVDPDTTELRRPNEAGPSIQSEALPLLPSQIKDSKPTANSGPAPDPAKMAENIPNLSEQQVNLLLSSVGLKSDSGNKAAAKPAAAEDELAAERTLESLDLSQAAGLGESQARRQRNFIAPMKQIYIRQPVGSKAWANQSFTPNLKLPESHEGAIVGGGQGHSGDQAWVAEAMAAALDKYRNSGNKSAGNAKGSTIDDSF